MEMFTREDCVFYPDGTTNGVTCAGDVQSYWVDDGDGDVCEQPLCQAHAPPGETPVLW